jgi:hypothetical protein
MAIVLRRKNRLYVHSGRCGLSDLQEHMCGQLKGREQAVKSLHPLAWQHRKMVRAPTGDKEALAPPALQPPADSMDQFAPSPLVAPTGAAPAWGDRYVEQQQEARCGKHALNNVVGSPTFVDEDMEAACSEVLAETGDPQDYHLRVGGWYSHSVLGAVLQRTIPPMWRMLISPLEATDFPQVLHDDLIIGSVVNMDNHHWIGIAKHRGCLWKVDSKERPQVLSEGEYKALLRRHPLTFAIVSNEYDQ